MKTKPVEDILPIPLEVDSQRVMDLCYNAIHEMVCYGTVILSGILRHNRKELAASPTLMATPLLFRHVLELLDAVSILLKSGIVIPGKVQLRAILEAYLSLEYLLEEKTEERAVCFFVVDYYRQLNLYGKHIQETPEHADYLKEMEHSTLDYSDMLTLDGASGAFQELKEHLDKPQFAQAKAEYLRLTNDNSRKNTEPKWYALYGGPRNLYRLSLKLRRAELYDWFYKPWSNSVHGTDLGSGTLVVNRIGKVGITQLRDLREATKTAEMALNLGLLAFTLMAHKVVPKEAKSIARWGLLFEKEHHAAVSENEMQFENFTYYRA